jgi:hypothetical protein
MQRERLRVVPTLVVGLALVSGCAMRVSGVVRDAATGGPIGGAVLSANDGRNRISVSDPAGVYAVKTDSDITQMTVSAPGYQAQTVAIPGGDRFPVVFVDLQPNVPPSARRAPVPTPVHRPDLPQPDAPLVAPPVPTTTETAP